MRKQRGMTFVGMIFVAAMLVFVAIISMKLVPAYLEFFQIKKIIATIQNQGGVETAKDVLNAFEKRASIDNIKAISASDLVIKGTGSQMTINVSYSQKVPLMGNLSACLDFTTEK